MNVLLVASMDQEFGGVASVVGNLARYLEGKGHKVFFLHSTKSLILEKRTTKWGFSGFGLRLIPAISLNQTWRTNLGFIFFSPLILIQLLILLLILKVQIVNIHYPKEWSIYFAIGRWLLPVRLVTSVHGTDFLPDGKPKERYSWALKSILKASDLIVAPSLGFLKEFCSIFAGFERKAIFIHNGIDLSELNRVSSDGNRDGKIPERYLLTIAALNVKKGLDVLIKAFAQLKDTDLSLYLVLVGDGPLRAELEQLAAKLAMNDRIKFLGWRGRSQISKLLHGCEAFVLPSRSEPFGIAILEALACKKPVIATAVGGVPEIIESGRNGVLVEPDDPLALAETLSRVVKDRFLRESLVLNGHGTVMEKFSCERTGRAYEDHFVELL